MLNELLENDVTWLAYLAACCGFSLGTLAIFLLLALGGLNG